MDGIELVGVSYAVVGLDYAFEIKDCEADFSVAGDGRASHEMEIFAKENGCTLVVDDIRAIHRIAAISKAAAKTIQEQLRREDIEVLCERGETFNNAT